MKLLFLLLLCVLILARSARSPSFDVRLHGSSSIPIASFVERSLFIKNILSSKVLKPQILLGTLRYTTAGCYYGYLGREGLG